MDDKSERKQQPDDFVVKEVKKRDFSAEAESLVATAKTNARSGHIDNAITDLLALEKRARLGSDAKSVEIIALAIVDMCFELRKWDHLSTNITVLCKRRNQFKNVQAGVIRKATEHVFSMSDDDGKDAQLPLIETLRSVSEGNIFVEAERARLTYRLAIIKERDGDIVGAADILQEENVETYGSLNKREKTELLLEQIRLCMAKKDFIRAFIISKKVNRQQLDDLVLEDLKIRFFRLLIEYYSHEKDSLELAKAHIAIFRSPSTRESKDKWIPELQASVLFLCISPYDNHQVDLIHNLLTNDKDFLSQVSDYQAMLKRFVTSEIAQWPLPEHAVITKNEILSSITSWTFGALRDRVIEHDIRVVAGYYTQIRISRLAELLRLSIDETEKYVSSLVTTTESDPLVARMDRPAGIVSFPVKQNANEYLTDWSDNLSELLGLLEKTTHLINKEVMLAGTKR